MRQKINKNERLATFETGVARFRKWEYSRMTRFRSRTSPLAGGDLLPLIPLESNHLPNQCNKGQKREARQNSILPGLWLKGEHYGSSAAATVAFKPF